jgi:hypothetical protein
MKLKFYLKTALFTFCTAMQCFASVNTAVDADRAPLDAENTRVLAGIQYITQQDTTRCAGFNADPVKTMEKSPQTDNIINLLSNKTKVSAKEASEQQKQVIATSVMGTIIVHGVKKLTRHGLSEGNANFRHFRALELIEDLSFELNRNLIDQDGVKVVDQRWLSDNWTKYSDLETYSKITAEMFELWFNAALEKHNPGFVKLAEIKQAEHDAYVAEHARIELKKAQKAEEEERLRLKKIEEAEEAVRETEKRKREKAAEAKQPVATVLSLVPPTAEETTSASASSAPGTPKKGEEKTEKTLVSPTGTITHATFNPGSEFGKEDSSGKKVNMVLDFGAAATGGYLTPTRYQDNADTTPPGTPYERVVNLASNVGSNIWSAATSPLGMTAVAVTSIALVVVSRNK